MNLKEFNVTPDTKFIITKLSTGEQIVAILRGENEKSIVIEYPMEVNSVRFQTENNEIGSHTTAEPFCKFANDRVFHLAKRDLIYLKKLHQYAIPFYVGLLEEYESYLEVEEVKDEDFKEIKRKFENISKDLEEQLEEEGDEVATHRVSKTLH